MKFGSLVLYKKESGRTNVNILHIGLATITLRSWSILGGIAGRRFLHNVVEQFFVRTGVVKAVVYVKGVNKFCPYFFFRFAYSSAQDIFIE